MLPMCKPSPLPSPPPSTSGCTISSKSHFHDQFRPQGCSADVENYMVSVITAEAGVQWDQLYEAIDAQQQVGNVSTAGRGYMQGGGHSPLSPLLGLAAGGLLFIHSRGRQYT
ncbi:hypothetical protein L7F22_065298 [Adiantum nelumboides]|nr:hypothetical protein [Adiantum nelumboides]